MSWIRGKLADHVGDHAVLSPEEVVLVTFSGTELSHPRPSQSLNNSEAKIRGQETLGDRARRLVGPKRPRILSHPKRSSLKLFFAGFIGSAPVVRSTTSET